MLLTDLPRPQFLLSAWTARWVQSIQQRHFHISYNFLEARGEDGTRSPQQGRQHSSERIVDIEQPLLLSHKKSKPRSLQIPSFPSFGPLAGKTSKSKTNYGGTSLVCKVAPSPIRKEVPNNTDRNVAQHLVDHEWPSSPTHHNLNSEGGCEKRVPRYHTPKDSKIQELNSAAHQIQKPNILQELFPEGYPSDEDASHGPQLKPTKNIIGLAKPVDWTLNALSGRTRTSTANTLLNLLDKDPLPQTSHKPLSERATYGGYVDLPHVATVLLISNVSKSLSEADFSRLSPEGKHIEGWRSGMIQVIPGRDSTTLEALGHYYLLFSSKSAALEYQREVTRLHHLSTLYTAKSVTSYLPPPPGYLKDGEDVRALLQAFTLVPASQRVFSISKVPGRIPTFLQKTFQAGTHPLIAAMKRPLGTMVLFTVDDGRLTQQDIYRAIRQDGRDRNLDWNLLTNTTRDIVDILRKGPESGWKTLPLFESKQDMMSTGGWQKSDDYKRTGKGNIKPRFVVLFADKDEARRFVRSWHRRPFPIGSTNLQEHDIPAMVDAEVLW